MTMTEKKMISIQKEIEKLQKSLSTHKERLEKKNAKCKSLDCDWTREEMIYHSEEKNDMTDDQWSAWFNRKCEESEVEDLESRIANANKRLQKVTGVFDKELAENAQQEADTARSNELESYWSAYFSKTPEQRKAEYEAWLKSFKDECLKDGIKIDDASNNFISGTSKSGNHFMMSLNSGYTERSLHCYTLVIDGQTVFTSGYFETGYRILKKKSMNPFFRLLLNRKNGTELSNI